MHDFTFTQEFDWLNNIGVINKAQDVVVSDTCFLLGSKVLVQVCNRITGRLNGRRAPRKTACGSGINACGMVNEIRCKAGVFLDLFLG